MKKRRIKTWVKVALLVIVMLIIVMFDYLMTQKAIRKCVSLGNSEQVCIEKLG